MASKTAPLPGMTGAGIAPLSIPAIDKAISKYERKKDERCKASPGEIAAKQDLKAILHKHRDQLPMNSDGVPFYRYDDVDYLLEETLKRKKYAGDDTEGEDGYE